MWLNMSRQVSSLSKFGQCDLETLAFKNCIMLEKILNYVSVAPCLFNQILHQIKIQNYVKNVTIYLACNMRMVLIAHNC